MDPFFRLSIEDLTVVLDRARFVPQADYRTVPTPADEGETIGGAPIITGPAFRAKHLWNLPFYATREQFDQIQALWEIWDHKRRNPDIVTPVNNNLIIDDGHEEIREYAGTNSRALAIQPDLSPTPPPVSVSGNIIQYFSRFYAKFTAKPTRQLTEGPYIITAIALRETDLFPV